MWATTRRGLTNNLIGQLQYTQFVHLGRSTWQTPWREDRIETKRRPSMFGYAHAPKTVRLRRTNQNTGCVKCSIQKRFCSSRGSPSEAEFLSPLHGDESLLCVSLFAAFETGGESGMYNGSTHGALLALKLKCEDGAARAIHNSGTCDESENLS